jgi:hypothetical protein
MGGCFYTNVYEVTGAQDGTNTYYTSSSDYNSAPYGNDYAAYAYSTYLV